MMLNREQSLRATMTAVSAVAVRLTAEYHYSSVEAIFLALKAGYDSAVLLVRYTASESCLVVTGYQNRWLVELVYSAVWVLA